jgi:hypothetical protein
MSIETFDQFMDTILDLVSATETNPELALSAATTIGLLYERGYSDLAEKVLLTFKPESSN